MLNFFSRYSKCHPYGSCCEGEEEVVTSPSPSPSSTAETETETETEKHHLLTSVIDQVPLVVVKPKETSRSKEKKEVTNCFSQGVEQGTALGRQSSEARRLKILRGNSSYNNNSNNTS
eukprot:scaffold460_cov165-Ochromonas_danica.AAC.1